MIVTVREHFGTLKCAETATMDIDGITITISAERLKLGYLLVEEVDNLEEFPQIKPYKFTKSDPSLVP